MINILFAAITIGVTSYFAINLQYLTERRIFVDDVTLFQIVLGLFTLITINVGAYYRGGIWLPIINVLGILYIFTGQFIPGRFGHLGVSMKDFIDSLFLSSNGIWGTTMGTASGSIILVIMFSTFLLNAGFDKYIIKLLSLFVSKSVSAFGKITVLASALFGMISGGGASNVSAIGSITIPTMIQKGYSPTFAAAIESSASMASTFTPPVLGSVAFLMADILGIGYKNIVLASFVPALLYYFSLYWTIDFKARSIVSHDVETVKAIESTRSILIQGIPYLLVLAYFIAKIMLGFNISKVSLESILLIVILFSAMKRLRISDIPKLLVKGIKRTLIIIPVIVASGIFVSTISLTGLISKFGVYISPLYEINIFLALTLVMVIIIFIGTALNAPATYIISVAFFAPLMSQKGFDLLAIHFFILYYAAMGSITPPVALTSLTASTIANASFMRVSFASMFLSFVAYLIPFVFLFNSQILYPHFSIAYFAFIIKMFLSVFLLVYGFEFPFKKLVLLKRITIIALSLSFFLILDF